MKVHWRKSRIDEVPLQKSAAMAARISGEIGSPSTIGRDGAKPDRRRAGQLRTSP